MFSYRTKYLLSNTVQKYNCQGVSFVETFIPLSSKNPDENEKRQII